MKDDEDDEDDGKGTLRRKPLKLKAGSLSLLNLTLGQFLRSHSSQKRNSIQNLMSVACDKYISILLLGREGSCCRYVQG